MTNFARSGFSRKPRRGRDSPRPNCRRAPAAAEADPRAVAQRASSAERRDCRMKTSHGRRWGFARHVSVGTLSASEGADVNLRRENFGEEIGVAEFSFESPDGTARMVTLRVGKRYLVSDAEWACPVELSGFEPRHPDMRGGSSMQALCLGISLIRRRVDDFLAKGGKIFHVQDGSECEGSSFRAIFGSIGSN